VEGILNSLRILLARFNDKSYIIRNKVSKKILYAMPCQETRVHHVFTGKIASYLKLHKIDNATNFLGLTSAVKQLT